MIAKYDGHASLLSNSTVDYTPAKTSLDETSPFKNKQVSFNLHRNQEHANHICKDELSGLWYTESEKNHFFLQRETDAAEFRAEQESPLCLQNVLTRVYKACCKAQDESCSPVSPVDALYLRQYSDAQGLHQCLFKYLSRKRNERRTAHKNAVLNEEDDIESLSLSSRVFAQTLAVAVAGDVYQQSLVSI
jgi:hypothetical protein